jgi:malonyl-CoA O-methyltransferase
MSETESVAARRPERLQVDAVALQRQLRRLAAAEQAPWLNAEIAQRMAERLAIIKFQPERVLQWSAFLGASDAELRRIYPQAQMSLVEPVEALRARSGAAGRRAPGLMNLLRRREAGAPVLLPVEVLDESAQLLWSNMYLHMSPDPQALIRRWHRALQVDGFVMFSCLGPDSLRELRELHVALGFGAAGPEWIDMHDIGDMLVETGFADPVMDQERLTLTWREPARLLADLQALGGNLAVARFTGLRTPRWRENYMNALGRLRGADGLLRLTVEVAYGHAFKPLPRAKVEPETRVTVEQMKALVRKRESGR